MLLTDCLSFDTPLCLELADTPAATIITSLPANVTKKKSTVIAPAPSDEELQQLLARIGKREEASLAALYDATVSRVYGLALRIVRDTAAAEEVVEDVFLQVWKTASAFDPLRGRPITWLLTICRSRALDHLRRKEPAELHPDPEQLSEQPIEDCNPQDLLLATEKNRQLHEALKQLSAIQRQLLSLAFFRGLTHEEISAHAEMPLGTVKTHVRRALQTLRELLSHFA